jgi:glycosyltransferase involved in cell wall biosynthesis
MVESLSRLGHQIDVYSKSEAINSPNCAHLRQIPGVAIVAVDFVLKNPYNQELRHWLGVDRRIKPGKSYLSRRKAEKINKSIDANEVKVARIAYKMQTPISENRNFSDIFRLQRIWLDVAKQIVINGADLVWCVDLNSLPGATWASRALNVPLVYAPQESFCDLEYLDTRQLELWRETGRRFTPRAHSVVSVSAELAEIEKAENGARNLHVIHSMPDTSTEEPCKDIKSHLGLAQSDQLAVVVGNVVSNRGVEIAIRGIAQTQDWHLAVVGGGSEAYLAELTQQARDHGVAHRVHFTGAIPRTCLTAFLESADLNLIPALPTVGRNHELSMPNKLFDGLSAGLPVLAVAGMALTNFVVREGIGTSYEGDNYEQLANKLSQVAKLKPAAHARRSEFVWLANDELVEQVIHTAVEQHAADSQN